MNVRSFADLNEILIAGEAGAESFDDDYGNYEDEEFEDESPVKAPQPAPEVADAVAEFPDSVDPLDELPAPNPDNPISCQSPASTLSDEEGVSGEHSEVRSFERPPAVVNPAPERSRKREFYVPSFMKQPNSIPKPRPAKTAFLSRVSWNTDSPVAKKAVAAEDPAREGSPSSVAAHDLENAIRKVIKGIEEEKKANIASLATRKAVPIPSLSTRGAPRAPELLSGKGSPSYQRTAASDLEDVVPFYDPDYQKALTMDENLAESLIGREYTHRECAKQSTNAMTREADAAIRLPADSGRIKSFEKSMVKKNPPRAEASQAQSEQRSANVKIPDPLYQPENAMSSDSLRRNFNLSTKEVDFPKGTEYSATKLRARTDQKVLDMKIAAESIYASFIKDVIGAFCALLFLCHGFKFVS